jgi:hypothetical protein
MYLYTLSRKFTQLMDIGFGHGFFFLFHFSATVIAVSTLLFLSFAYPLLC